MEFDDAKCLNYGWTRVFANFSIFLHLFIYISYVLSSWFFQCILNTRNIHLVHVESRENFSQTTKLLVCLFIDCLGTTNFNFEVMNAFGLFKQVHNSIQWSANCAKKAIYTWRKKGFGHNEKGTIVSSSQPSVKK